MTTIGILVTSVGKIIFILFATILLLYSHIITLVLLMIAKYKFTVS